MGDFGIVAQMREETNVAKRVLEAMRYEQICADSDDPIATYDGALSVIMRHLRSRAGTLEIIDRLIDCDIEACREMDARRVGDIEGVVKTLCERREDMSYNDDFLLPLRNRESEV